MKKKLLLMCLMIVALVSLLAISAFAESAYVNANGEQVEAGSSDIAYEIEFSDVWNTTGNCRLTYIYLYDTSVTKIVVPAIELTHSNGTVYKMAEYSYVRLSTGWGNTLSVYAISDKETKANSLHTQIKELELHIPTLGDGAGSQGNLAGWTGLEKLSFYGRAYENQSKGGFLSGCTSIKEIHFYAENNVLTGNHFPSTMVAGGKVVFHENATGTIRSTAIQNLNGKDVTVYMNTLMQPADTTDPRLTWNKNGNGLLKFVLLVKDKSSYTSEQIASYETTWQAGNNKSENNAKYSMPINTFCEYYGEHIEESALSSCVAECLSCKLIATSKNAVHNTNTTIVYDDFSQDGTKTVKCLNDNCPLNVTPSVEKALAIFECIGYSVPEDERIAVTVGYTINKDALGEYKAVYDSFEFGVFGVLADAIGKNELFKEDGELTTKAICAELTDEISAVTLKITGFTSDDHKSLGLAMGIYTKETVEEQSKYTYVQPSKPVEGQKYSTITYNEVTQ